MNICINKDSVEYQSLLKRTDISEYLLNAMCTHFLEEYGRFPFLDELPNSNSEQSLREDLKIKQNGSTRTENILEHTGKSSVEEAIISINNTYRDLEVDITPILEYSIVDIKHRPNKFKRNNTETKKSDLFISSPYVFTNIISKLVDLYGIKVNTVTNAELSLFLDIVPDDKLVNAFIHNGEIYINTDRADVDAPIHEMLHLLIGSMRFSNHKLYELLIQSSENLENYDYLSSLYRGKSRNDINEEIFVTEVSKYLTGMESSISSLNETQKYEIKYNITRMLDSILMGDLSTGSIDLYKLSNMTLKELTEYVNSDIMTTGFSAQNAEYHRLLNNMKSDLLSKDELKEICE